ncbi:TetR family transcriptional regulator [Pseudodesulfovibrio profundus]|uniref:TetR family transcriptional regulator n=1 Tax=Pseudodesulfovibrio profundus TaxID=57320 RepID=A0A2C8F502_9BACT|nr:TetR/AcrR family transcriptional regulator [Pseudodesulfovibrio profundus]SOB56897.1 TetR family transcriptional regulator [Pseudodesulfovibrio profundus]
MSQTTKERIIEVGADLVHRNGFNNTGLKDILQAAGIPKGSFYFYFTNKETFGLEMIDYYRQGFRSQAEPILTDASLSPLNKLRTIFDQYKSSLENHGFARGCPIGNLASEMSDLSEPFRQKLDEVMTGLTALYQGLLDEAIAAHELPQSIDTYSTAVFMVESWHGAIIRMKVAKNAEPLTICYDMIFNKILR